MESNYTVSSGGTAFSINALLIEIQDGKLLFLDKMGQITCAFSSWDNVVKN